MKLPDTDSNTPDFIMKGKINNQYIIDGPYLESIINKCMMHNEIVAAQLTIAWAFCERNIDLLGSYSDILERLPL